MGTVGFEAAFLRNEPLADLSISFRAGIDPVAATARLNALADDFDVRPFGYYAPHMRIASATRAALLRLFGWRIERVPEGPAAYTWATVVEPNRFPEGIEALIAEMGLSQPGADDDGQYFEWP